MVADFDVSHLDFVANQREELGLNEQRRTEEKLTDDRRRLTREMIKVFLVAYLAYSLALDFEDLVLELTGATENDLSADMKNMVKSCTEVAMAIDKGAGNGHQVAVFGELTDDLEDWFKDKMSEELESIISNHKQYDKFFS